MTLVVAVVDPSRATLALHAAADHGLVAYCTAAAAGRYPRPTPTHKLWPARPAR